MNVSKNELEVPLQMGIIDDFNPTAHKRNLGIPQVYKKEDLGRQPIHLCLFIEYLELEDEYEAYESAYQKSAKAFMDEMGGYAPARGRPRLCLDLCGSARFSMARASPPLAHASPSAWSPGRADSGSTTLSTWVARATFTLSRVCGRRASRRRCRVLWRGTITTCRVRRSLRVRSRSTVRRG